MARGPHSASSYLTSRVKEALYNANGNKAKAMQQIISWSAQDMDLLQALTRAHLSGIVAYHVDRISDGKAGSAAGVPAPNTKPKAAKRPAAPKRKAIDPAKGNPFGQAILKAASSTEASIFGMETYQAPSRVEDHGSSRQAEIMKHLASFSQTPQDKRT